MMADAKYLEWLWHRYRNTPSSLPDDWRNAFDFISSVFGDPYADASLIANTGVEDVLTNYLRRFGHIHARLDPLNLYTLAPLPDRLSLGADNHPLSATYLGTLAVETGHLDRPEMKSWIENRFEDAQHDASGPELSTYQKLLETEVFDHFLAVKFPGKKRFGSEGADAIIPLLDHLRKMSSRVGIDELVIGSMHRGRLSIMTNVFDMDPQLLLGRIRGDHPFACSPELAGDLPYHLGVETERDGMRCTLLPNPSHLEAVNPVAIGYTRARRTLGQGRATAIIVHTDASVIGQGVNAELLQMSTLAGFEVGGTIHIVINNQVGFTTEPSEARSSRYCAGPWRAVDSLILHANGDDVDGVLRAGTLALDFRNHFARDAVIDVVCYRANGHNEIDEPRFTQPRYYHAADAKAGVVADYERRLVEAGKLVDAEAAARRAALRARLEAAFVGVDARVEPTAARNLRGLISPLSPDMLHAIIEQLSFVPEEQGHPKMIALMKRRRDESTNGISWALAETMAFASVLDDGVSVRLCGQDIERGPFSQRHLAAIDPESGERQHALRYFAKDGATLEVVNSPLSEYAVLGFEYGYSLAAPGTLCIWEAQFGDFANGAQIIIDQFIVSGYEKWRQSSNLTVLLPHGLEGQGPEHSSARIERLVQLCARDNISVAHPSTPANYFHLLRRQALIGDRPLFVITPKVLLRLHQARSSMAAMASPAGFAPVIPNLAQAVMKRVILCSGKIAYELERESELTGVAVAILRLEILYPFPELELTAALARTKVAEMLWLQEEPANFGAGAWLAPKLATIAAALQIALLPMVARPESASPAGSFHSDHDRDQHALLRRGLGQDG